MTESDVRFEDLCARAQFQLDSGAPRDAGLQRFLPDYLARVRSESLLVTSTTAPKLYRLVEQVQQRLGLDRTPEVYVQADPTLNAFAPAVADTTRPVAIVNSGLVQLLTLTELSFALGHELGHLGLSHEHRPASAPSSELDALGARSRHRYAELSADRVGLLACRSTFTAANVMIKTASGLPSELLGFDIDQFIAQVDRAPDEISRAWELELTHPALPFRLWALLRFSHSDVYSEITGQGGATVPIDEVEHEIVHRLDRMGDGRLSHLEDAALERALTWVGASIVLEDGIIEDHERAALELLVGATRANKVLDFLATHGIGDLESRTKAANDDMTAASAATRSRFERSIDAFRTALSESGQSGSRDAQPENRSMGL